MVQSTASKAFWRNGFFVNLSEKVPGELNWRSFARHRQHTGILQGKTENPERRQSVSGKSSDFFRKHGIAYFIYVGGNDSMDTVDKLAAYCKEHEIEDIHVMGAPKTIDNDLVGN